MIVQVQHYELHRSVNLRLLPLFFAVSLLCQLDRSNLSFAALQLRADFYWFSSSVQGVGSGLFFIGYLAQLASQLVCVAMGARRWLAVILVVWGCVAMAFATLKGTAQFLLLRFLLGMAESGAYPAMYYHLSLFYRESELGVAYTWVATATAVAGLLGGPMAAGLISLDGKLGLRGWQWLFVVEGTPPLLLAALLWLRLPDSPLTAGFLSPQERSWLHQWVHGGAGLELAVVPAGRASAAAEDGGEGAGCQDHEQLLPGGTASHMQPPGSHQGSPPDSLSGSKHVSLGAVGPLGSKGPAADQGEAHALLAEEGSREAPSEAAAVASSPSAAPAKAVGGGGCDNRQQGGGGLLREVLADWRVWELGAIMWAVDFAMNAVHFFLPTIIWDLLEEEEPGEEVEGRPKDLHQVVLASMLAALPFTGAGVCMVLVAFSSKRHKERRLHTAVPLAIAACAFGVLPPLAHWLGVWPALACLTVAASGIWSTHAPLFSWPAQLMEPRAGAIAFAAMKTMGALGGFAGPSLVGLLAEDGSVVGAMLLLAGVCGVTAAVVAVFPPHRSEPRPSGGMPLTSRLQGMGRRGRPEGVPHKYGQLDCELVG